jgi:hypothetical protein
VEILATVMNVTSLLLGAMLFALCVPVNVSAGPPYITDDPEPVEYQHWEVYLASIFTKQPDSWTTTAPCVEVNYGLVPDAQLHTILPMTLYQPSGAAPITLVRYTSRRDSTK